MALDLDAETSDCADVAVPKPVAPTTREPEIPGHQHVASKRELLEIMSNCQTISNQHTISKYIQSYCGYYTWMRWVWWPCLVNPLRLCNKSSQVGGELKPWPHLVPVHVVSPAVPQCEVWKSHHWMGSSRCVAAPTPDALGGTPGWYYHGPKSGLCFSHFPKVGWTDGEIASVSFPHPTFFWCQNSGTPPLVCPLKIT